MAQTIKVRCFISIAGAAEVPWEALTPEQQYAAGVTMRDRMKSGIEEYYAKHPDEWNGLQEEGERAWQRR